MNTMIERYIYDVTRRLPEAERADVKRELDANIRDMLPEQPTDEDISKALEGLGSPSKLADSYRQNPRCLISSTLYDEYIGALKWVLPLVGTICLIIGLVVGCGEAVSTNAAGAKWVSLLASNGISMCVEGLLQALFWTTIGFAIADRAGHKTSERWTVDKLPDEIPSGKGAISLADGIVDLILSAVFTAVGLLIVSGSVPVTFLFSSLGSRVVTLFNADALSVCVPAVAIAGALGIVAAVIKIICRRWNLPVCCAVIADNIAGMCAVLYIITRPNLWSDSFLTFIADSGLRLNAGETLQTLADKGADPLVLGIGIITIVISAACIATAIVKTVKARGDR